MFKRMLTLAAMLLAAAAAQAQVAGPTLVPAAPRILDPQAWTPNSSFTAENPAAMMWAPHQRFGGGQISSSDTDVTVVPNQELKYTGNYAGFEKITKEVAIGLEMVRLNSSAVPADEIAATNGALATTIFPDTSMGFAMNHSKYTSGTNTDIINSPMMGVSYIKGGFVLGFAFGSDEVRSFNNTIETDYVRPIRMFGLGFYRDSGFLLHIEANRISRSAFGPIPGSDSSLDSFVVEGNVANIHVGYTLSVMRDNAGFDRSTFNIIDIGYAKMDGFAVLYHLEKGTRSQTAGGVSTETDTYDTSSVSIALHF